MITSVVVIQEPMSVEYAEDLVLLNHSVIVLVSIQIVIMSVEEMLYMMNAMSVVVQEFLKENVIAEVMLKIVCMFVEETVEEMNAVFAVEKVSVGTWENVAAKDITSIAKVSVLDLTVKIIAAYVKNVTKLISIKFSHLNFVIVEEIQKIATEFAVAVKH